MKESKYYKKKLAQTKKINVNKNIIITKFLIAIIIVLSSLILTNLNSDIKKFYTNTILEHNISFASINKFYQKYIGDFTKDETNKNSETVDVANTSNDISSLPRKELNGSYEIEVGLDYPVTFLASGIIVYIGDKGDLKNTIIVQGNDGIDIWYSNIINDNYSLYDYVSKGNILGTTNNEKLIISILKDGKKLSYDEYF